MEGYLVKLSFLIEGQQRTFNTLGLANGIFRHSLSGPMYVIGSCISNLPIVDTWFGFIVPECNCSVADAIQMVTKSGAKVALYHDSDWSKEIDSLDKNIAVDDVTFNMITAYDNLQIGIYPNSVESNIIVFIISFVVGIFILCRFGVWGMCKFRARKYLKISKYSGDEGESCTICLDEIKKNEIIRTLPCSHIFHKVCIDKWFEKKQVCPNCNQSAFGDPELTPLV